MTKNKIMPKTILEIENVNNWNDLSTFMIDSVKKMLYFDTFSILTINKNRTCYQKVAGVASGLVFFQDLPYPGTLIEHNVNIIEKTGEPMLFNFTQDFSAFRDRNIIANLQNYGQLQAIVTTLNVDTRLCGIMSLDSYRPGAFGRDQFSQFQSIADQIAVAVESIRNKEKGIIR